MVIYLKEEDFDEMLLDIIFRKLICGNSISFFKKNFSFLVKQIEVLFSII